jgi:PAS domain S-box-containing protein
MNKKASFDSHLVKKPVSNSPGTQVTRSKKRGESQQGSGDIYRTVIENLHEVVFTLDRQGHFTYINPAIEQLTGFKTDQVIGGSFECFIYPDDLPGLKSSLKRNLAGQPESCEFRILDRDGKILHMYTSSRLIRKKGKAVGLSGVMVDITEQKQSELALRQRAEGLAAFQATVLDLAVHQDFLSLLRMIVERSTTLLKVPSGFIYLYDETTNDLVLTVEKGFGVAPGVRLKMGEGMAGRVAQTRQMLIVDNYSTWEGRSSIYKEIPYHAIIEVPMVLRGQLIGVLGVNDSNEMECKFTEADAHLLLLFAGQAASVVHDTWLVQGLQSELTERKRAEESLREAEARYRTLVEQIPAIVYTDSAEKIGQTHYISPQIESILGYDPDEWAVNNDLWTRNILADDRKRVLAEYKRTYKTGEPFTTEYRMTSSAGKIVWIRDEAVLVRDQSGHPLFWQGIMHDITERKQAEVALEESEDRYHQLFDLSPDAIAVHSGGKILLANTAAMSLVGVATPEEIIGKPLLDFVHPDYRKLVIERTRQQIAEGKVVPVMEEKFIRLDGTEIDVEVTAAPIHFQDSLASLVIFRDITERKQAQALQDAVYRIAIATETTRSLNDLFPQIHEIISSVMPAENFYINLYDEEHNVLRFPYFKDIKDEPYLNEIQPGQGLTAYVLRTGKSLLCTQAVHDELERQGAVKLLGVPSAIWLGVPLVIEGKTIGVMVVQHYSDPDAYGERDQHMLEFVSTQVAIAISRKQAEDALQRQLKELTVLHSVSMNAAQASSVDQLIEQVTKIIGDAVYVDDFGVALFDQAYQVLQPHPSYHGESFEAKATIPLSEGIMGYVASTGEPYCAADVRNDPHYLNTVPETLSELCVPIKVGEKLIGVINAESRQLNFFSEDDERLLNTIASTLGTAIEKLRLFDAEHTRRQEAETLRQVAQVVNASLDVNEVIRLMLDQLKNLFAFDTASVLLLGELGQPDLIAGRDYTNEKMTGRAVNELLKDSSILKQMAQDLKPLTIADVREHPGWIWIPGAEHVRSFLAVPLIARQRMIGVLMADSVTPAFFSEDELRVAQLLAQQMAIAIENAHLYQAALQAAERRVILHRVSQDMVTAIQEPERTYQSIHQATRQLMPCDSFVIALHDEVSSENTIVYALEGNNRFPVQHVPAGRGLTGRVVTSGEPIIIDDLWADKTDVLRLGEPQPVRSLVAVPLRVGQRTTGMISAQSYKIHAFGQEEQALLEMLASYAAVAIENARLYQEAVRASERRSILHEVSQEIVKVGLDLERVYEAVHHAAERLMPAEAFVLSVLDEVHNDILFAYLYDEGKRWPAEHSPVGSGLSGKIIETGKALIINDLQSTPLVEGIIFGEGKEEVRSLLAVPLRLGKKVFGMLSAQSYHPYSYTEEDQALLEMLGAHSAVAIENTRLYEAEQRRLQESEILREAAAVVASTLDQDHVVQLILDQLARVVSYDSASVLIMRDDYLEIVGGQGWEDPSAVIGLHFPIPGDNPNTLVVQQRSPVILGNAPQQYASFRQKPHNQILSWLGVPMIVRDRVIGILAIDSKQPDFFTQESIRLVSAFASQAATTIENARLYEEALQAAELRAILHRASQEIAHASQDPEQVYAAVHRAAVQLMPAEAFVITLLDEQSQETVGVYLVDKGGRCPVDRAPAGAGLSALVVSTGKPVITDDLMVDPIPGSVHFGEEDEVRSILAVPLRLGEKVIGMLSVQSYQPHAYTGDDQTSLEMLAANAAVAIDNARLYAETLRRLKELEAVNHISTALRSAQTVDDMLPTLLDETLHVLGSDSGMIMLYNPAGDVLKQRVARGWFTGLQKAPIKPGEGIAGAVFKTGQISVSKEFATDLLPLENVRDQLPVGWGGACVPIRTVREAVGVLFVSVELPRQLQADEINLLVTLSEMAGNAIRRADLHEQTERQLQRLASLRAVDMAINTILDLRVTLGILIDHIISQLRVDAVNILLINPNTQTLYNAASSGFRSDAFKNIRLYIGDSLAGQAIRTRTTVHIPNLSESKLLQRVQLLTEEGFVTYFGVPLIAKGQIKGVLEAFHRSLLEPDSEWRSFLETLAGQAAIAIDNSVLFEELQQTNLNLSLAYDATIEGWSRALDLRDRETEGHTQRVTEMTVQLADLMGIGTSDLIHIRRGALLHDIGKMGVPDSVLNKTGPLNEEEWAIMHRHPEFAFEMLSPISYLRQALDIPYGHHERWDGSGYPRHLPGEQIPLAARIFAVVDVWDALISARPYRKPSTREAAAEFVRQNSGILFDPRVVETFLRMLANGQTR